MTRALAAAVRALAAAAAMLVRMLTLGMLAVLAYQVFMRSVLGQPPSWTEEVALLGFSWAVLLGVAYGVREGIHVRMDLLLEALPRRARDWCERGVLVGISLVGAFLAWSGWNYAMASRGTTSAAIAYPMPLLYASASVCGLLVAIFGIERLVLGGREPVASRDAA